MTTERLAFDAFHQELREIEKQTGLYLSDECVDAENMDRTVVRDSKKWYAHMIEHAKNAAGMRAEEAGMDINQLMGRVVY